MRGAFVAATPTELFERHHAAIYRYLLRMIGSRETAEELTQEVFMRVLKGLERYQERDRERAWLFRIARNLRCDYARQRNRQPRSTPLVDIESVEPPQQELRLSLALALAELNDHDREAFLLVEIAGFSYMEAGVICETTPAAIRSRIYRARLALKFALDAPASRERSIGKGIHV
jgi:RNA polymerase sigma factor (sigma-70 family)